MPPGDWALSPGTCFSRRVMFGTERNGQNLALNTAQSRCDGGSAETRFTAHIGPIVNARSSWRRNGVPQTQHRPWRRSASMAPGRMMRKSGTPSIGHEVRSRVAGLFRGRSRMRPGISCSAVSFTAALLPPAPGPVPLQARGASAGQPGWPCMMAAPIASAALTVTCFTAS